MRTSAGTEGMRWLAQAERDLDDARFALSGQRFNLACFLCQQSAEKALKGYLFIKGAEEVWGHSVAELSDDAKYFDKGFAQLKPRVALLDKYYIPTRYPNALPGGIPADAFDEEDARRAISLAEETLRFIKDKIEEEGNRGA